MGPGALPSEPQGPTPNWMKTRGVTGILQETLKGPLITRSLYISLRALPSQPKALFPQLDEDQRHN